MLRTHWRRFAFVALLPLIAACGSSLKSQGPVVKPTAPGRQSRAGRAPGSRARSPSKIPSSSLIASSDRSFKAGQKELEQGHVEAAKQEFNRAVDVLLESPYGARTEPRIREHFDRLVDRISTYEVRALATGDGFTEKKYEPASIDELLAMSATLGTTPTAPGLKDTVAVGPADRRPRHPDPAEPARAVLHRAVPGPAPRLHRGRHEARQQVPADDSERLPRRRAAARPGLRAAGRERLQAERAVARQGQGRVAVHDRHRRWRTACATTGTSTSGPIPKRPRSRRRSTCGTLEQDLRRRLAPGARLLQRRPRPHAARAEDRSRRQFLDPDREVEDSARAKRASTCR